MAQRGLVISRVAKDSLAQRYGFLESDIIDKINGKPTRYMPLGEASDRLESQAQEITIIIQRDITVWS